MSNNTRLTWGLILGLALAALGRAPAQVLPFKNATNGYQFAIPKGWRLAYIKGPDAVLLAPPPLQGTNVTVVTNEATAVASLEQVQQRVNQSKLHPANGFQQLSQAIATVGSERVVDTQVTYVADAPLGKMWARQVDFLKYGNEYELTCTARFADKDAANALFATLLKSVQWAKPLAAFTDDEFKQIDTSSPAYAFIVPTSWTRIASVSGEGSPVMMQGPKEKEFTPAIIVLSASPKPGSSVEQEQTAIIAQYSRDVPHYALQSQWFTSVDGAPALETSYTSDDGKRKQRNVQVLAIKGDRSYIVTGIFPVMGYEKDQAVFDRLLASVRWVDQ